MDLITWSPALDTGITEIDDQHRELVRLINALDAAVRNGDPSVPWERTHEQLVDHISIHFRAEEQRMAQASYPLLHEHHLQHGAFAIELVRMARQEGGVASAEAMLAFLMTWLVDHVQGSDRHYVSFLTAFADREAVV